jgi:hypothetical protein
MRDTDTTGIGGNVAGVVIVRPRSGSAPPCHASCPAGVIMLRRCQLPAERSISSHMREGGGRGEATVSCVCGSEFGLVSRGPGRGEGGNRAGGVRVAPRDGAGFQFPTCKSQYLVRSVPHPLSKGNTLPLD